ncbi:peptidylprolyl isomerase, partial [bacterium]|nr:peptidylprolyl isomerase [bacterium]
MVCFVFVLLLCLPVSSVLAKNTVVILKTSMGTIEIELFDKEAPLGTANFLHYVDSGFYDGAIFHRVIPNFMLQGGGFDKDMNKKQTAPPIKNEANNG